MEEGKKALLKQLPKVDLVLNCLEEMDQSSDIPRPLLVEAAREAVESLREEVLGGKDLNPDSLGFTLKSCASVALKLAQKKASQGLKKVINATGIILHTNLGRSILAGEALNAVREMAGNYSNLEFDLDEGERGERYSHVEDILCRLTGAEAAMVVNNNAAAVLLALSTLAKDKEVVVSRGELVEIGGSFRIPAVMAMSGARLVEVGTTNKTHLADYRDAITLQTALLMKVHTSNYRVVGFTKAVSLEELVALGQERDLPVLEDLGSGVLTDLSSYGVLDEPSVKERVAAGAAVVTFSGDKLLGGPQAGIIVGKKEYISRMKKNQLTRALRIDKMTLAALEATLRLYINEEEALKKIPTLRMLTVPVKELESRAHLLARSIKKILGDNGSAEVRQGFSAVGGGALPLAELATYLVSVSLQGISRTGLAEKLRRGETPLIIRVQQDQILLDPRTLQSDEEELIPRLFATALEAMN